MNLCNHLARALLQCESCFCSSSFCPASLTWSPTTLPWTSTPSSLCSATPARVRVIYTLSISLFVACTSTQPCSCSPNRFFTRFFTDSFDLKAPHLFLLLTRPESGICQYFHLNGLFLLQDLYVLSEIEVSRRENTGAGRTIFAVCDAFYAIHGARSSDTAHNSHPLCTCACSVSSVVVDGGACTFPTPYIGERIVSYFPQRMISSLRESWWQQMYI